MKQWMKDERYCKKKLAQFRKEYAQPNSYQDSPAAAKEDPSSQPSELQSGSSERTDEDSPKLNGTSNVVNVNGEESVKSTPASGSSPRKRCRGYEGRDQYDENEDIAEVGCEWGPQKRSKSDSPAISPPIPSPVLQIQNSITAKPGSLKSNQGAIGTVNLSLPVMGTPTKREREEGEDRDGDVEMKDMLDERVVKKVRSRSNSPSCGFEVKLHPAVVHTGA